MSLFDDLTPEQKIAIDFLFDNYKSADTPTSRAARDAFRERMAQPDGLDCAKYKEQMDQHPDVIAAQAKKMQAFKDAGVYHHVQRLKTAGDFLDDAAQTDPSSSEHISQLVTAEIIRTNVERQTETPWNIEMTDADKIRAIHGDFNAAYRSINLGFSKTLLDAFNKAKEAPGTYRSKENERKKEGRSDLPNH